MSDPIAVAVAGAGGRLGATVLRALSADPRFTLSGALVRPGSPLAGRPVPGGSGGLHYAESLSAGARPRVFLDASRAAAVPEHAALAAERGSALLVAVTGLAPEASAALESAARRVAVLEAPNLSLGALVLGELVRLAARRLSAYDVEIVEAHHAGKRDSPSGTALWLARQAAAGRGGAPARVVPGRSGSGARESGEIGIQSVRAGTTPGEHRVRLGGPGEHLELSHVAESREAFASGALRAIAWLASAPTGRYTMEDIREPL